MAPLGHECAELLGRAEDAHIVSEQHEGIKRPHPAVEVIDRQTPHPPNSASPGCPNSQERCVDAGHVKSSLLEMQRYPPRTAADVDDSAADVAQRLALRYRPVLKGSEIDFRPCSDFDEAVIALQDLGVRSAANPIKQGPPESVRAFHARDCGTCGRVTRGRHGSESTPPHRQQRSGRSRSGCGPGMAVIQGWHPGTGELVADRPHAPPETFTPQQRDLYVPAGDVGFWQAGLRDVNAPIHAAVREAIEERRLFFIELLYTDHEGGQRAISRFLLAPGEEGSHGSVR